MRLLVLAALVAVVARPVTGATILYATAASQRRIDGFRVLSDGSLEGAPDPGTQTGTRGTSPRRLVKNGCTLYVAEDDRIEVFHAEMDGHLTLIGATRPDMKPDGGTKKMATNDVALSDDGHTLYVPSRKRDVIGAYPLGVDGAPNFDPVVLNPADSFVVGQPKKCLFGPPTPDYEDITVGNGKLYVTELNRVAIFGLDAEGMPFGTARTNLDKNHNGTIQDNTNETDVCPYYSTVGIEPIDCPDPTQPKAPRPKETCPLYRRDHISSPIGIVLDGTTLVVGARFTNRLVAFTLQPDGSFPAFGVDPANPTSKEKKAERKTRKPNQTGSNVRYLGITLCVAPDCPESRVFATAPKGFINDFRIAPNPSHLLPHSPNATSHRDVASTPVRTTVRLPSGSNKPVLYMATGELDRITAYQLDKDGGMPENATPFSKTDELSGSYPNDVVVIDTVACD